MRHRLTLPTILAASLVAATVAGGLLSTPALAAPTPHTTTTNAAIAPSSTDTGTTSEVAAVRTGPLPAAQRGAPVQPTGARAAAPRVHAATQSCTAADFAGRSGAALVGYVQSSTHDCINSLFTITGSDAHGVFQESQMLAIANGFQQASASYPGDDSTGIWELIYFLRAGFYVQYYDPTDVGSYDASLSSAARSALDAFFASPHSADVSAGNGDVLGDAVILTDSANLQGDYLTTYARLLTAYNSSYDAYWSMDNAVNSVYTPLWRGNWNPAFVTAVAANPSIINTLSDFALGHLSMLGGSNGNLDYNAGNDLARMAGAAALQGTVRSLAKGLLGASSITGSTAELWVHVAYQTTAYDPTQCTYYGTCDLTAQLTSAALPGNYACDNRTIRAQALSAADLAAVCASLRQQDPFFHNLVHDNGPIPGEYLSTVTIAVFASKNDYDTYSWAIFGNDTNNGGETLTGDPTNPANQAVSIMYQKPTDDGFVANVWNLNHEYTHYLDARYDTKGAFNGSLPDIWWIEGLAEYVSYTYRGVPDTGAITEAGKHTYALSTLWQSSYANSDVTRTYPWGYLAVRYMVERHPDDVANLLAHLRSGDYTGAIAVYQTGIGTRYDADFDAWLTSISGGGTGGTTQPCPATDTRAMGQNCYRANQAETKDNLDYLYLWLPAGSTTLNISTTGGTGNAALYYDPDTWATPSSYTASSTNAGTTQSLTVTNTTAGYRYLSLYANTDFSGVTVTTQY